MMRRVLFCLALLGAARAEAATPGFLLGIDYTEWGPNYLLLGGGQIATDGAGALYILSLCSIPAPSTLPFCVTKLSPDGKTILWQNNLGFTAAAMAVDPNGGVYVIPASPAGATAGQAYPVFVEKLTADGSAVLWQTQIGNLAVLPPVYSPSLAVDSTGRAFVAGSVGSGGEVVRLNPAGAIDATFSNVPGAPAEIAVDPTGADVAVVFWETSASAYGLARLEPDNATWAVPSPPLEPFPFGLAVAANGDVVANGSYRTGAWYVERIDPSGNIVFATTVPGESAGLALDASGNTYITGFATTSAFPVKNSIAPCDGAWLSVIAPNGSTLQTTYLPGSSLYTGVFAGMVAVTANSAVFVFESAGATFAPTQPPPFPDYIYGAPLALYHLSPNADAQTFALACVGNGATFSSGPVAPGEIVTLSGNGLGPQEGVQPEATLESPYPTQAANVEVIFDGTPAPLLWVQDAQINTVVPWSVAGPATKICVTYKSVPTNCLTYQVAEALPGVFTTDGTHAAAVNQDGTPNTLTNPAPPNSIVMIYATGLGPINPPQADGSLVGAPLPVDTLPVELRSMCMFNWLFGCSFNTYAPGHAGPALNLVAGASQINFVASDANSSPFPGLQLVVETPSGETYSNFFQIYVAGQ
jgi:uncharacterized protein (TIGR03437 family)